MAQIFGFEPFGYEGSCICIESDIRKGNPTFDIVGLADGCIKETRDRVKNAFKNSKLDIPERVLISLMPESAKKVGIYDLGIALSILNKPDITDPVLVLGELDSTGEVRPVKAVYAALQLARNIKIPYAIIPKENENEAREVKGIKTISVSNLTEAKYYFEHLEEIKGVESMEKDNNFFNYEECKEFDSSIIDELCKKQPKEMRAIAIAIAGKHHLLAYGEPGCGKTFALQYAEYLTPKPTVEEAQSITRIHSIAGLLSPNEPLMRYTPFRMPHQTATIEGIYGGGASCRPGEISLAHNGVLFLDEAAEFKSSVLQMLRVPLESGSVTLSRAGRSTTYPACFQLLMATNPCPCGSYGSESKICLCSAKSVERYWLKFSAPLLDRISIKVHFKNESESTSEINFEIMKNWIETAIRIQRKRYSYNEYLGISQMDLFIKLDNECKDWLNNLDKTNMSQRQYRTIQKIARTIADMEDREIELKDLQEAFELTKLDFDFSI